MLNGTGMLRERAHEIWWARRGSNPRPIDYESTALTAELQALMRSEACHTLPRRRSRAGIVTTKKRNATGITRIPAAFAGETLEISSLRGTTSACRNGSGDAACAAPWPRSDGSAHA